MRQRPAFDQHLEGVVTPDGKGRSLDVLLPSDVHAGLEHRHSLDREPHRDGRCRDDAASREVLIVEQDARIVDDRIPSTTARAKTVRPVRVLDVDFIETSGGSLSERPPQCRQ